MNHYVLTRSAFDPRAWDIDANRRRLEVTRTVTVPLMAAQTNKRWSWIVLVDPDDPFRDERIKAFDGVGVPVIPIVWRFKGEPEHARWDRRTRARTRLVERMAASAYRAPWRDVILPSNDVLLQTRLDDDDGLAPDAIERYQGAARRAAAGSSPARQILMLPQGVRVYRARYNEETHERNAMHTLVTFPGDTLCVYDYGHAVCHKTAPVSIIDRKWGWLWVRHQDTISGWKVNTPHLLDDRVRGAFPIDWPRLGRLWH